MYYWNTKALAHELAEDTLSKQHYKNYYLAAALVVSAVYYYGMYSPYYDVRVIGVEAVLTLVIMLIGVQRVYQANGGDQGISAAWSCPRRAGRRWRARSCSRRPRGVRRR